MYLHMYVNADIYLETLIKVSHIKLCKRFLICNYAIKSTVGDRNDNVANEMTKADNGCNNNHNNCGASSNRQMRRVIVISVFILSLSKWEREQHMCRSSYIGI